MGSFRLHCGPGINSASNRNEYQDYLLEGKGGRFVGLITLPPLGADCPQILGTSESVQACIGIALPFLFSVLMSPFFGVFFQDAGMI
jgi:hypothetical protein